MALLQALALAVEPARGERTPLCGPLDLELSPGMALAIEGPSGCGKTTLLRALALLEPLARGRIVYRGSEVDDGGVPLYRRRVHYLAQRVPRLGGTVERSLAHAFSFAALRRSRDEPGFDRQRAEQLCARLLLPEGILRHELADLAGGEAQRVALVRALLTAPEVLLLDEPTSALDAASRHALEEILHEWLGESRERAMVVVSHDSAQLARLATHRRRFGATRQLGALEAIG